MATILYARTSTAEQTIEHQQTQAEAMGYHFDQVVVDDGVSGIATKLAERPQGKRLFDLLRPGDTLVVRWVDRLGRNYEDVSDNIREFMRRGVVVKTIINGMSFDGAATEPMAMAVRDSLIAFMAALSQAQAEATKEAQAAGIEYAKANPMNYRGRKPSYTESQVAEVVRLASDGVGVSMIAKQLCLSRQTVYRIQEDPSEAIANVQAWN